MITNQRHIWTVSNSKARTILDGLDISFDTFVDPGIYEDSSLELVWQIKKNNDAWWDNLAGEPNADIRAEFICRQLVRDVTEEGTGIVLTAVPFQQRVLPWVVECFGLEVSKDVLERSHRFLEEALELVQSCGYSKENAFRMVTHVFNRPVGETHQEIGGVMVTLAQLCNASEYDMVEAGETELAGIWNRKEQIKEKHLSKPVLV